MWEKSPGDPRFSRRKVVIILLIKKMNITTIDKDCFGQSKMLLNVLHLLLDILFMLVFPVIYWSFHEKEKRQEDAYLLKTKCPSVVQNGFALIGIPRAFSPAGGANSQFCQKDKLVPGSQVPQGSPSPYCKWRLQTWSSVPNTVLC
jgi:hypothetical protein